jgi:parallel beta-helix repeat protein
MKKILSISLLVSLIAFLPYSIASAQKFLHPGIDQTAEDLAYMKNQVQAGAQPWKDAFERLKTGTDLSSPIKPFAHVQRGPYGKPNIGGGELDRNVNMAYDCALIWYITDNKAYADKAIEIINTWSPVLWDFDYNDAKLLAAWTGHMLCNAAEILRYTKSGWQQKDIESFTNMLMTVYYPLMRYYYPQANGNWDGAIIHSILAIAIFTNNNEMFDNAIDHFLHGPVNGSIFKYIYPSGQCQESMRDQAHVQLGLGEFAGAARVAYTQGVDLFSIGNNRIALGYEYTAGFLLGEKPQCYGIISERAKRIRDDYEYVYRHYASQGVSLPFTKMAADSARTRSTRNTLTAFRAPSSQKIQNQGIPKASIIGYPAGAMAEATIKPPEGSVFVIPGESIQEAINSVAGTGKWVVAKAGIHTLPGTLKIPSGVTLAGEGLNTILFLDPAAGVRVAIVNAETTMHDITIRDLVIEGNTRTDRGSDPNSTRSYRNPGNRGGIMFLANKEGDMKNINLVNLTVQNCTYNGVFINGVTGLNIICCDFNENGSSVVPGPKLQHNLLITHCTNIIIKDSRLDTSPYGSGLAFDHCHFAKVTNCEVARNAYYGILIAESNNISIAGNLIEANDKSGIMIEFLYKGSEFIEVKNNHIQYNNGYGIESYAVRMIAVSANNYTGNGNSEAQQRLSEEKYIIMQ